MADYGSSTTIAKPNRRRRRNSVGTEDRKTIADRVVKFYNEELINRQFERETRLQRYAKYRMWSQETDWPWPGASNVATPDMLQDSLRVQDTLVNAVMSQRPPVISKAAQKKDEEKQETIDRLIEAQIFIENQGERMIGDMAESFVNDPACTVFVPWIREKRKVASVEVFDEVPEDQMPKDYFFAIVRAKFPQAKRYDPTDAGWDWTVTMPDDTEKEVCFYTDEADEVEMVTQSEVVVFDGPRPMVKDYDDVLYPARSANLQMPGPSNPNGAPYVILRDFPTLSELKKLQKSGFYDLPTKDDMEKFANTSGMTGLNDQEAGAALQKDKLAGVIERLEPKDKSHKRLTRLTCFDTYDIDGDGIEEDVIFWVIKETGTLLKARLLIDLYPSNPPRRPFAGESFLPVGGRYAGMSILEIMEAVHDAVKVIVDQAINANDMAICSMGFYRPSGGMNPEVLRAEPFAMFPLQNPQQDISFPQIGNPQAMGMALNMINILGGWQEKLTMVNELSFGQVPSGGSSALRTIGGMSMVQGQGEARPERILRRFFSILTSIWRQVHSLNQSFLPKNKQFRIAGVTLPGQDPYMKIENSEQISGDYLFDFDANVLNTSKASLQSALEALIKTYVTPLMLQIGVVKPEGIYRLARDFGRSYGQNVDQYITAPTPEAAQPRILAEEAIYDIMNSQMPTGIPMEAGGAQEHLAKLTQFAQSIEFGHLTSPQVEIFKAYLLQIRQVVAQAAQQQMLQQNAQAFSQQRNQGQPGAPVQGPPNGQAGPPMVSGPNEMMNEKLPTAGGGANPQ